MRTTQRLEQVLIPRGFVRVKLDDQPTVVYGKVVRDNVTLRVYSWCSDTREKDDRDPFVLKFVTKINGKVEKIGSERRVFTHQLAPEVWQAKLSEALDQWEEQLSQTDQTCNKCFGEGIYRWASKSGTPCGGVCNRCSGRGFQDWNDRRKNLYYDRHIESMSRRVGEEADGETYADWVPHWVPDPENFIDPEWRSKLAEKPKTP